jgi:hypothetical protein
MTEPRSAEQVAAEYAAAQDRWRAQLVGGYDEPMRDPYSESPDYRIMNYPEHWHE